MKKQIAIVACLALLAAAATFTACRKANDRPAATELELQTTSTDLATLEDLSEQAELDADQAVEERGGGGPNTGCPTVTSTQPLGTFPNTITVDFGTDGCLRPNGRTLRGQIVIEQSAPMTAAGASRKVTLVGFFVDDVKVEGGHTAINQGTNAAGQPFWQRTGTKTITWPDGKTASWDATHTVTQTEGFSTPELADNVWQIEGSSSGTNRNGVAYTSEITTPLVKRAGCRWIESGVREIHVGLRSRTFDFGDGSCDNDATVTTANGTVFNIKLRG